MAVSVTAQMQHHSCFLAATLSRACSQEYHYHCKIRWVASRFKVCVCCALMVSIGMLKGDTKKAKMVLSMQGLLSITQKVI